MCVCVFFVFFFVFFSSFFAIFDFTLLINKMLYLKYLKSDPTQNWSAFGKIIVQDKCQVSKNFKQLFLRYIENTTGSARNFAKCRTLGSGEEYNLDDFTMYGHGGHLGNVTCTVCSNFSSHFP